ncbi:MAG: glycine cleavage system protein H [Burkholderiaceae bacterium]|jgi:glycine cleavage system H protein|nr:glycine cleavage system protein H [Burkholderiaceae bacterium]
MTADPESLYYLIVHQVWARLDPADTATVGITRLGIALAGEIYMCRVKRAGTAIQQAETLAVVELSKSIVAVKSPVSGHIAAINPALEEQPELVHRDPYGAGWLARLALSDWARDLPQLVHGAAVAPAMARHARLHRQE